jgi:hypothetical protein
MKIFSGLKSPLVFLSYSKHEHLCNKIFKLKFLTGPSAKKYIFNFVFQAKYTSLILVNSKYLINV